MNYSDKNKREKINPNMTVRSNSLPKIPLHIIIISQPTPPIQEVCHLSKNLNPFFFYPPTIYNYHFEQYRLQSYFNVIQIEKDMTCTNFVLWSPINTSSLDIFDNPLFMIHPAHTTHQLVANNYAPCLGIKLEVKRGHAIEKV